MIIWGFVIISMLKTQQSTAQLYILKVLHNESLRGLESKLGMLYRDFENGIVWRNYMDVNKVYNYKILSDVGLLVGEGSLLLCL